MCILLLLLRIVGSLLVSWNFCTVFEEHAKLLQVLEIISSVNRINLLADCYSTTATEY